MATSQEVKQAMDLFAAHRPGKEMHEMHKGDMGMIAVLKCFSDHQGEISSKDIADIMQVSSARMAILIKKMEQKGLIQKVQSQNDNRVLHLQLTDYGKQQALKVKHQMIAMIETVVDTFGVDGLTKLLNDMQTLQSIMLKNKEELCADS